MGEVVVDVQNDSAYGNAREMARRDVAARLAEATHLRRAVELAEQTTAELADARAGRGDSCS